MAATISVTNPDKPKRVLILVSNPSVSAQTGWPIGAWTAEFAHPYWEFMERGYHVTLASPNGGLVEVDRWSDPRDDSGYSAHDLLGLGFLVSPQTSELLASTPALSTLDPGAYDALFLADGQGPMYTFHNNPAVYAFVRAFYEQGGVLAVVCHATAILLNLSLTDGTLLVAGKTWTGFADAEEAYVDGFVGQRIQPFWIETEARKLDNTNYTRGTAFQPFAVRDGRLITGQQQYSGAAAARLVIEALGV